MNEREKELEQALKGLLHCIGNDLVWQERQPFRALIYASVQDAHRALGMRIPAKWGDAHMQGQQHLFDSTPAERDTINRRILEVMKRADDVSG